MADYQCHPLWWSDKEGVGEIDPAQLPISPGVVKSLHEWAETYDATLNADDPLRSGFSDEMALEAFKVRGRFLRSVLEEELKGLFEVDCQE